MFSQSECVINNDDLTIYLFTHRDPKTLVQTILY